MIPEKVTWVEFPAKISTVHSKVLPINDLVLQFLISHLHISSFIKTTDHGHIDCRLTVHLPLTQRPIAYRPVIKIEDQILNMFSIL